MQHTFATFTFKNVTCKLPVVPLIQPGADCWKSWGCDSLHSVTICTETKVTEVAGVKLKCCFYGFSWMWLTNKAFMLPVFFLRHSALWPVALVMHGWSRRDLKMVPLCVCYCTFTELSHGNDKLACSFGLLKAVILCFLSWHILSLLNHTMKVY